MNLTIAVDDRILERARALASRRGVSLQELLRQYLESLAGDVTADATADELLRLRREHPGRSGGRKLTRADAYEGRL